MKITGDDGIRDELASFPSRCYTRGECGVVRDEERENDVQRENTLAVYVNGKPLMSVGCSASHVAQLVCGRLFTEGLVRSIDEIEEIRLQAEPLRADVRLASDADGLQRIPSGLLPVLTTTGATSSTLLDAALAANPLRPVAPIAWEAAQVFDLAATFELDRTSHSRTRGAHSAYLADASGTLYVCEDIGRHNAFDKVVGCALIDGVDLTRCMLFTSGRVPTDMCVKAIRAGIPLLATKAVPTDRTIAMARDYGLTLICKATSQGFDVFA